MISGQILNVLKEEPIEFTHWFPQCVCPAVGLLGGMAVLFPFF